MVQDAVCPEPRVLEQLMSGEVHGFEEVEPLVRHIEGCDRCGQLVHQLRERDPLVAVVRDAAPLAGRPWEQSVRELAARLSTLHSSRVTETTGATASPDASPLRDLAAELSGLVRRAESADEVGRLAGYRLLKVLGAGGMGVVFQAEDTQLRRTVALKVMRPALAANATARQRFLREAQSAASLENDHIVPIFQVGEDSGVPFLAMPLLKGEPLDQLLKRHGKLSAAQVLRIGRQAAEGLAAAHERGLIHRDIKPANLWIEVEHSGRVKILDFGLARPAEPEDRPDEAHLTQEGAVVGTPAYMAPEQARGETVDYRSDLFSLGCVLYHLCAGEPPFRGKNAAAVLLSVAMDQPRPLHEINPTIPPPLSDLVMQLLSKKPADRPASARVVAEKLGAIDGKPAVPSPSPVTSPKRWNIGRALTAAAVAFVLLGGLAMYQIIVRVLDKDGNEVGRMKAPKDGSIKIEEERTDSGKEPKPAGTGKEALPPIPAGAPLNPRAIVATPAQLPGVQSWTLETVAHRGGVNAIAFSPDGKLLASAGADGTVRVWEPDGTKLIRAFVAGAPITSLAWSPDGRQLAVSHRAQSNSGTVSLWDVEAGRVVRRLDKTGIWMVWSPDGKLLATTGDYKVWLWDMTTGDLIDVLDNTVGPSFSPDGELLAVGGVKEVRFLSLVTRKVLRKIAIEEAGEKFKGDLWVNPQWSPDGKLLALTCPDQQIRVLDATTGKALTRFDASVTTQGVQFTGAVSWLPDSSTLACGHSRFGSGDVVLSLVQARTGKLIRNLQLVWLKNLSCFSCSPDRKALAVGADVSSAISILDVTSGRVGRTVEGHPLLTPQSLTWSAKMPLWPIRLREIRQWSFPHPPSPDGKTVVQFLNRKFHLADADSGKALHVLDQPEVNSGIAAWSWDSRTIATAPGSSAVMVKEIRLWDAETGKLLHTHPCPVSAAQGLAFSPDGKTIAVGMFYSSRGTWLLDAETGKVLRHCRGGGAGLAFSPDGQTLATGAGFEVQLWSGDGSELLRKFTAHGAPVSAVAWSPDGRLLATGAVQDLVRLWDPLGKPAGVLVALHDDKSLMVSPDGHYRGDPGRLDRDLVYVVQTEQGQQTLIPDEFSRKYKWTNNPDRARGMGR